MLIVQFFEIFCLNLLTNAFICGKMKKGRGAVMISSGTAAFRRAAVKGRTAEVQTFRVCLFPVVR